MFFLNFRLIFILSFNIIWILTLHGYRAIGIPNFLLYPTDIGRHTRINTHGIRCGGATLAETDNAHQELLGLSLDDGTPGIVLARITTITGVIVSTHLSRIDSGHTLIICLTILIIHHHQINLLERRRSGTGKVCSSPAYNIHSIICEAIGSAECRKLGHLYPYYLVVSLLYSRILGRQTNGTHSTCPLDG